MKAKKLPIGSRYPKVVLLMEREEDTSGAADILAAHIEEYRTIKKNNETIEFLLKTEPSVILFALGNVEKNVEYYKDLVEKHSFKHLHYSVILCNNKESSLAFRSCIKGLFDNYFVFQPLYEKLRLLMIVQNGLTKTQSTSQLKAVNDELFEKINDDLSQLIDEGSRCKQDILYSFTSRREELVQLNQIDSSIISTAQSDLTSTEQIMSTLTEEHITPLLAHLEDDIRAGLDKMLAQLVSKRAEFKADLQTNIAPPEEKGEEEVNAEAMEMKPKGLITHVPSIKKRPLPEDGDELPPISRIEKNTNTNTFDVKDICILIVEDNKLYRDMISEVLTKENYKIEEAEDGLCALQKIKDKKYDLILMDLYMPNLDGLNATKKIRKLSGGQDIPVIALTSNKNKEIVKKWANYGLKGYIIKPSTKNEITDMVKTVLEKSKEEENV